MRQPKFRGFNKKTNRWHYGFGWTEIDYTEEFLQEKGITAQAMLYTQEQPIECDLLSMGQSTFLTDKHKKEIFESDICKLPFEDDVYVVQYSVESGQWFLHLLRNGTIMNNVVFLNWSTTGGLEIVGNLYEHPELLRCS